MMRARRELFLNSRKPFLPQMEQMLVSSKEISTVSKAKRLRLENGQLISAYAIRLESHPQRVEIARLISQKKESGMTYMQLAEKIRRDFGVELGWKYLRTYYIQHFTTGSVKFRYAELSPEQKRANLWQQFFNAMADLEMERAERLMDYKRSIERGNPVKDDYKRGNTIALLRDRVLRLGSAVGYYPRIEFTGSSMQIMDAQVASEGCPKGVSPGLIHLFEGVLGRPADSGNL